MNRADDPSSSGKWQAWLAMEEQDAHCKSHNFDYLLIAGDIFPVQVCHWSISAKLLF